jgi:hypothetical protein
METLRGCGRSPGQLLLDLEVRDADTGAAVGPREAALRRLVLESPRLLPAITFRLRRNQAPIAQARAAALARLRDIEAEHGDEQSRKHAAVAAFFREEVGAKALRSFGAQAGTTLLAAVASTVLQRRIKARLPRTVTVRRAPGGRAARR